MPDRPTGPDPAQIRTDWHFSPAVTAGGLVFFAGVTG